MQKSLKNLVANFINSFVTTILSIVLVPIILKYLNIEAFSIISLYSTIYYTLFAFLDFAVGIIVIKFIVINRQNTINENRIDLNNFVSKLEGLYLLSAFLFFIISFVLQPLYQDKIIDSKAQVNLVDYSKSLSLLILAIALRWPISLYSCVLNGFQNQFYLNIAQLIIELLRFSLSLASIILFNGSTLHYFSIQIIFNIFLIVILRTKVANYVKIKPILWGANSFHFPKSFLKQIKDLFGLSLTSTVITQYDKFIILNIYGLKEYGYYSIAATIAFALGKIVGPIFNVFYPKTAQIFQESSISFSPNNYSNFILFSQLLTFTLMPVGWTIFFFSQELLLLWTNSVEISVQSSFPLSILTFGSLLNGLYHSQYAALLSKSMTRQILYQGIFLMVFNLIFCYVFTLKFGIIGAASCWVIINISYFIIPPVLVFKGVPSKVVYNWVFRCILLPLLTSLLVSATFFIIITHLYKWDSHSKIEILAILTTNFLLNSLVLLLILPKISFRLLSQIR